MRRLEQFDKAAQKLIDDASDVITVGHTCYSEAFHSLKAQIAPKNVVRNKVLSGLFAFTILRWNYGITEAFKLVFDRIGVQIPEKLLKKYEQCDKKRKRQREYFSNNTKK